MDRGIVRSTGILSIAAALRPNGTSVDDREGLHVLALSGAADS
jgi:hypothetical protein